MKLINLYKKVIRLLYSPKDTVQPDIQVINKEQIKYNHQINIKPMAIFNYGVGGNEVKVDANEAINDIQHNKTLLVSQLTHEDPVQPENVKGLKTVEEVFKHFKPAVDVEMETADGQTVKENIKFNHLGDFTPKSLTKQSGFLNNLNIQQEQYGKIMKQLKVNKVLQSILANGETKNDMTEALKQMVQELENSK
jgi:hypothetical protein